jgi:AAA family ATP:ADP antiporter
VDVRRGELPALCWSAAFHFLVLASFYLLRPMREAIGAEDRDILERLWTGTFLVMVLVVPLYSALVARLPRRIFVPLVYHVVALVTFAFWIAMRSADAASLVWIHRALYVWISVYNLLVVSIFWSVMVDSFHEKQGRRLFGLIAIGGTLGAIAGSSVAAILAERVEPANLAPISIVVVEAAVICAAAIGRCARRAAPEGEREASVTGGDEVIGGGMLAGIVEVARSPYLAMVAAYMAIQTLTSTFAAFAQAGIVGEMIPEHDARTAFFARIDIVVNVLTVGLQAGVTAWLLSRLGVTVTLLILPLVALTGFAALSISPTLAVIVVVMVALRTSRYAFARPAREVLYTVVSRESKFKAKAFLDTAVYRGGDVVSAWIFAALREAGLALTTLMAIAIVPAALWSFVSGWLGRRQKRRAEEQSRRSRGEVRASSESAI